MLLALTLNLTLTEARRIYAATDTLETRGGASLLKTVGDVLHAKGDLDSAWEHYSEAKRIRIATKTLQTPGGAAVFQGMGTVKKFQGDSAAALECYLEAKNIFEAIGGIGKKDCKELIQLIEGLTFASDTCGEDASCLPYGL